MSLQIPDGKNSRLQIKRSVEVQPGRFQEFSLKSCSAINQQEVIFQLPGLVWFIQLAGVMWDTRRGAFQLGAKPFFHISQKFITSEETTMGGDPTLVVQTMCPQFRAFAAVMVGDLKIFFSNA